MFTAFSGVDYDLSQNKDDEAMYAYVDKQMD